jgi:hypothetical protein
MTRLLREEFIDGKKPSSKKRSFDEIFAVEQLTKKLTEYYKWDQTKPFYGISSEKCSEMIILVGM